MDWSVRTAQKEDIMKKLSLYLLAFTVAAGALAGCAGKKETKETLPVETELTAADGETDGQSGEESTESPVAAGEGGTVTVTYVKSPLNVPSIVEKDQAIFSDVFRALNYSVAYSDLTTGPEQTQALASGDIQFLNAVGATSVILSASNGADIKIISMYSRSPKAFKLFSKDGSIKTPLDLKGKKVAGPKGTILHELLVAYLKSADLTEDDIEFVSMGIPDSQAALVGGSVDAALLAGPAAYNMEKDGYAVVTDGEGFTDATIVTATSGKFYEEHPELVKTFLTGQKKVLDYMKGSYEEAMAATAKETELTVDAVKEMYDMYDFDMEISDKDIEAMKNTEQFMKDTGMIEHDVDVEGLILNIN